MKCFICNKQENNKPNFYFPILVLLNFYNEWPTYTNQGGVHHEHAIIFTPLGKTNLEGYYCPNCVDELNKTNDVTKKKSKIWLISTLTFTLIFNLTIFFFNFNTNFYYLNILFCLILLLSYSSLSYKIESGFYNLFVKSEKFKTDIDSIINRIELKKINFLNFRKKEEESLYFAGKNKELAWNKEDILVVNQNFPTLNRSRAYGNDGSVVWFSLSKKGCFSGEIFGKTNILAGGHRFKLKYYMSSLPMSKTFKTFKNNEQIYFDKYNKIVEL